MGRPGGPGGNKNGFLLLIVNTDHNSSIVKSGIERWNALSNVKLGSAAMNVLYGTSSAFIFKCTDFCSFHPPVGVAVAFVLFTPLSLEVEEETCILFSII